MPAFHVASTRHGLCDPLMSWGATAVREVNKEEQEKVILFSAWW